MLIIWKKKSSQTDFHIQKSQYNSIKNTSISHIETESCILMNKCTLSHRQSCERKIKNKVSFKSWGRGGWVYFNDDASLRCMYCIFIFFGKGCGWGGGGKRGSGGLGVGLSSEK